MSKRVLALVMLMALALPMALGACAPKAEEPPAPPTAPPAAPTAVPQPAEPTAEEPASPLAAIDPSGQTVTFWHVWGTGAPSEGLTSIVDAFNATNEWGITVEAIDQGRYGDLEDAMNAAIQSGDLPDLVVGYNNALDTWASVGVMVDINDYINDAVYGMSAEDQADFYPAAWSSGLSSTGTRAGFPHGQSANVLFYNYTWGKELGFGAAPSTWTEFKDQACAAAAANTADDNPDNDGTGGLVLYTGASNFASWVFAFGDDMISDDGTAYNFNTPVAQEVMGNLKELWDQKCAFATESYPNPEFATRKALFTASSTAGLPYQLSAFTAEGAFPDTWGFIPFPGKDSQAVDSFAQNSGIVATTPERSLAAWLFIKYFTSPEVMAKWIEASAYHPTRAATVALLSSYIAANPLWGEGLDLLPLGMAEPGWSSWGSVRRLVGNAFAAIIQGTPDQIASILAGLDADAADALAETQ